MNKPLFLLPFIFVYKLVFFILKLPFQLIRYFCLGFFFTIWFFINIIIILLSFIVNYGTKGLIVICYGVYKLVKMAGKIFEFLSFCVYKIIKYFVMGCIFPFVLLYNLLGLILKNSRVLAMKRKAEREKKAAAKKRLMEEKRLALEHKKEKERLEKLKIAEEKRRKKEEQLIKQQEEKARKKRNQEAYINDKVKKEKKTFAQRLNSMFEAIGNFPKKIVNGIKNKINNSSFAKNARNKRDLNRQALLISFEGEEAEKSDIKIVYQYEAKSPEGKFVRDYFEAYSKVEVHSFLLSEGYEVYSIKTSKWIQFLHGSAGISFSKVRTKDLIFLLTQLSTYIKAGIPLVDALKILTRQYKRKSYQRIFRTLIYDLTMGDNFSDALTKQGNAFPKLLINMVKASEMTGELPEALDDMAEYYTQTDKTRKQMVTAMMYPSIIFILAIAVMTFVMVFVVPQFVEIYQNMDATEIPKFTQGVIAVSDFLKDYILWLLIGFAVFVLIFWYLYRNVKVFRTFVQWVMMHTPGFGNIIIYNEVTMFTKTFASLLAHNVFITDSMEILNKITNNEIYKMLILDTITNLAKGEKISLAFKDHWAFPIPAYEMIVTGEKTGQLAEMMSKVSSYYQELHSNAVLRIKTFVEPVLIIFLTAGVGTIILAIIIPMFDVYGSIENQAPGYTL